MEKEELLETLEGLDRAQVHGNNIRAKARKWERLKEKERAFLFRAVQAYNTWRRQNAEKGYGEVLIRKRVKWVDRYMEAVHDAPFSAQSKFRSTILEEFLFYLFRDLVQDIQGSLGGVDTEPVRLGGVKAYSYLYFAPENMRLFLQRPGMRVNEKDQDFAIYRRIRIQADGERREINVPVVSIECKTYVDKTMLEGSIATAEKIKSGNPYCMFAIVTEWYDVSREVDPAYSRIDQIYVLRRSRRRPKSTYPFPREDPLDPDVVIKLFRDVQRHLERDWSRVEKKLEEEGTIL